MKFKVFKFKKVKSTNNTAIRIIKNTNTNYGMIISENQNNGRGQYGKRWISYKGNLFISFFYKLEYLTVSLKQITKINCLLVKKLLSIYYKKKIVFKKPNDLFINKKKISGILQETITVSNKVFLITGIGINIVKNPIIRNYPTTNMRDITNKNLSKVKIEKKLKQLFEKNLSRIYKMRNRIR